MQPGQIPPNQRKTVMTQEEQNEYITKLQKGTLEVPDKDSLEGEACNNLRALTQEVAGLTNQRNRAEKDREVLESRISQFDSRIKEVSGEMTAYANLLLSAEDKRRGGGKSTNEPIERSNEESAAILGAELARYEQTINEKGWDSLTKSEQEHVIRMREQLKGSAMAEEARQEAEASAPPNPPDNATKPKHKAKPKNGKEATA